MFEEPAADDADASWPDDADAWVAACTCRLSGAREFPPPPPTARTMSAVESKLSILRLVYPPISNQEAHWLAEDKEVEALLRQSDFYMIGARAEAKFLNLSVDTHTESVTFDFTVGKGFVDAVSISLRGLPAVAGNPGADLSVEAGDKILRIWRADENGAHAELLDWFTTEKLLFDKSRGKSGIERFERCKEAYEYDLLYVGIAKVGDSFDRLIAKGHKARMDILANEPQRLPGARVSDEIYLFLFRVEPLFFKTFDLDHDFQEEDLNLGVEAKRIVADAEKAFVRLLDPKYNTVKYQSYPKGSDGLYGSTLVRYGYSLGENITFNAPNATFRGSWDPHRQFVSNAGDCIFVEGGEVDLFVSGVHYGLDEGAGDTTVPKKGGD